MNRGVVTQRQHRGDRRVVALGVADGQRRAGRPRRRRSARRPRRATAPSASRPARGMPRSRNGSAISRWQLGRHRDRRRHPRGRAARGSRSSALAPVRRGRGRGALGDRFDDGDQLARRRSAASNPGVMPAEVADADDRHAQRLSRHGASRGGRPTTTMPASLADAKNALAVEHQRPPGVDRQRRRRRRRCIASIVATPTTGTSNRMSCFGFATLTTRTPAPASCAGPRDHLVGPFHRLDRDHRLVLDDNGLADVERRRSRRPCGSRTRSRRARRSSARGASARPRAPAAVAGTRSSPSARCRVAHARRPRPRSARRCSAPCSRVEHRQQRQVRDDAGEDLDVLDLAGHHRLRHAGRLEDLDALAQLAERDPVEVGAGVARRAFELGKRLLLDGDDGDVVAEAAGARSTRKGNLPLPAIRPMRATEAGAC